MIDLYLAILFLYFLMFCTIWLCSLMDNSLSSTIFARLFILFPIWPVGVLYLIYKAAPRLIKDVKGSS